MIKKFHKKVLKNIKKQLKNKKITQLELANSLNIAPSTLSGKIARLKAGNTIELESLYNIAKALQVDPAELLK